MVEAEREGVVESERAAEAHAAIHGEPAPTLDEKPHDLEEVLVPAHGDAVFGNAAESGHHPLVQRFRELVDAADRPEFDPRAERRDAGERRLERLDLEPVDGGYGMAVVHEMVREIEAGGPEPDHQHLVARVRPRQRTAEGERIPAREPAGDLEPPGEIQPVLERGGLPPRDVYRLPLLG